MARAALSDTLAAVAEVGATRRVLVLEGHTGPWLPAGIDAVAQRGSGLEERLAAAFADCGAPSLLIGMDTPQVSPSLLQTSLDLLMTDGIDAVLGPTFDGGYWAIGLRRASVDVFSGVPMSSAQTSLTQRRRLEELGLRYELLQPLRDIDYWGDALAVARLIPSSRLTSVVARIENALARVLT